MGSIPTVDYSSALISLKYELQRKLSDHKTEETIYHYTSPDGFEGILFKNNHPVIWFSRFDCLNDVSEGKEIVSIFQSTAEQMLRGQRISEEFFNSIKEVKPPSKLFFMANADPSLNPNDNMPISYVSSLQFETYICSFSKAPDDLAMWNYYVKGKGYDGFNIGFDSVTLNNHLQFRAHAEGFQAFVFEVIYQQSEKEKLMKTMIEKVYEAFQLSSQDENAWKQTIQFIEEYLGKLRFWFKSEYFQHEQEIRVLINLPTEHMDEARHQFEPIIRYRRKNNYTVPYFEMHIERDKNEPPIITSVTLGPTGLSEESIETQCEIMKHRLEKDYPTATVHYSKAPVRY